MSKKGFYIKSIISTGDRMLPSRVDFHDGCNLLFGPSEKGKSSVFSIIEYMLGSRSKPKEVKESRGYTDYYMEFVTYEDNVTHTAHRRIGDSRIEVENCTFEQYGTGVVLPMSYPLTGKNKITYSSYLMNLNGYSQNLQLKKSKTSKVNMTFSFARRLFLVSENRIVSENPIFIPINDSNSITGEKSFLYYITTGQDDSTFTEDEDEKIRSSRFDGKITLARESLDNVKSKIHELGDVSFVGFRGEEFLEELKKRINKQEKHLCDLYEQRKQKENEVREQKSNLLFAKEFVKRMTLLKDHYNLDLKRYEHLYQGLSLIIPLSEEHTCPVCKSQIVNCEVVNDGYKEALYEEYISTQKKLNDIVGVVEGKEKEIEGLKGQIDKTEKDIEGISCSIRDFIPFIDDLKKDIENIEKKVYSNFLQEEAKRLNRQIDDLLKQQKAKPKNSNYVRQSSIDIDFCNSIKSKLYAWKVVDEDVPIVYNESDFDFSIGGQKRTVCGKGQRGVTCTAIMMTLIEFCKKKEIPFSQLLVVDSPITAHFSDERVEADKTTQSRFFDYCDKTDFDYQLIFIDNKAPSTNERKRMTGIHFVEFSESQRNGFYLGRAK